MKLRLVTANLWVDGAQPEAVTRLIETERPDVLALQELGPEQAEAVAAALPHGQLDPESVGHNGMGIALRRPARMERLPLQRRDAHIARLDPGDWPGLEQPVEIVNVHVLAPHTFPWWRALAARRGQLRELLRHLDEKPHDRRLVCGDLNATPLWPVYRRLAAKLDDLPLLHANRAGQKPARTWGPGAGAPRVLRIDHVFSGGANPLDVRTVEIAGSDHSALVVDVDV